MEEFEQAARLRGYTNFRRERGRYCHAQLQDYYMGWMDGRKG